MGNELENEDHLKGLSPEEKEQIRRLAKLTADIILKDRHEKKHASKQEDTKQKD